MPDLSGLPKSNAPNFVKGAIMRLVFQNRLPEPGRARSCLVNVLLLSDKVVREYEAARGALEETSRAVGTDGLEPAFRAAGHLESCVESLFRLTEFINVLPLGKEWKHIKKFPGEGGTIRRLAQLRDAIQHSYEDMPHVTDGAFIALYPDRDGIAIHHFERGAPRSSPTMQSLKYADLAKLVRHVVDVATELNKDPERAIKFLDNDGRD